MKEKFKKQKLLYQFLFFFNFRAQSIDNLQIDLRLESLTFGGTIEAIFQISEAEARVDRYWLVGSHKSLLRQAIVLFRQNIYKIL